MDDIPLERGLCFYYEMENEFEKRSLPVEKQVAIAFEAGRRIGQSETRMCKNDNHQKD